jgi:hypothetical protein
MKNQLRIIAAGLGLAVGGLSLWRGYYGGGYYGRGYYGGGYYGRGYYGGGYYGRGHYGRGFGGHGGGADHCSPVWKPQVQGDTRTRSH